MKFRPPISALLFPALLSMGGCVADNDSSSDDSTPEQSNVEINYELLNSGNMGEYNVIGDGPLVRTFQNIDDLNRSWSSMFTSEPPEVDFDSAQLLLVYEGVSNSSTCGNVTSVESLSVTRPADNNGSTTNLTININNVKRCTNNNEYACNPVYEPVYNYYLYRIDSTVSRTLFAEHYEEVDC